jgi:2-methylcitrate dehydratase PrpD
MTKSLHAGICAHDGIEAALLAKKGFTSNPNVLEAEFGFRNAFVGGNPSPEEPIIEMMNNGQWDIATESLAFKMYPACYCGHCTIGAMIELSKRENINPEEVESICIEAEEFIFRILQVHNPKVGLASFTDEKVKEMAPLMKKVTTRVSAKGSGGIMGTSATVEVKLKDGRLLTNTLSYPLGNANNPINWDQLFEKYRECVSLHYSSEDVSKSEKILRNLEQLDQFQRIVEIFSK